MTVMCCVCVCVRVRVCVCVCVYVCVCVWAQVSARIFLRPLELSLRPRVVWAFQQVPRSMGRCGGAGGKGVNDEQANGKGKGKGKGKSQPSGRGFGSSAWGAGGRGGFRNEQGNSLQKETWAQLVKNNRDFEKTSKVLEKMLAVIAKNSPSTRPKQEPKSQKDTWTCIRCKAEKCSRQGRSATSAGSQEF